MPTRLTHVVADDADPSKVPSCILVIFCENYVLFDVISFHFFFIALRVYLVAISMHWTFNLFDVYYRRFQKSVIT